MKRVLKILAQVSGRTSWLGTAVTSGATLLQSQVCRAQDDVLGTHEAWRAAMIDKGGAEPGVIVQQSATSVA